MKKKIEILILIIVFGLNFSCKEEEKSINRDLLMKYNFSIAWINEYENNHTVFNDTVIYSFNSPDTVMARRFYYKESASGVNEFEKRDTSYRVYFINENKIKFQWITDVPMQVFNENLFEYDWIVADLNENELVLDLLYGNSQNGGRVILKCKEK